MKQKFTFLIAALMLLTMMILPWQAMGQTRGDTETVSIASYATANSWVNESKYATVATSHVTFTGKTNGNNGKYYSSNNSWRHYENDSGDITITVPSGYTLSSVTFTYSKGNYGALYDGSTSVSSGTAYSISGTSKTFTVGHTQGDKKGNVQITNISVTFNAPTPSLAVSPDAISKDYNEYSSTGYDANALTLTPTNISGTDPEVFSIVYCATENGTYTTTIPAMMGAGAFVVYHSTAFKIGWNIEENETTSARECYFKVKYSTNTYSNAVHVSQGAAPEPDYSVTLSGTSVNAPYAGGTDNSITVSTNLTGEVEYEVQYKQGNNSYAASPNPYISWLSATVTNGKLECTIQPNSSGSERSAQLKIYAMDDNLDEAYSDVVTVTQTPIAAPTFDPNGGEYHGTVYLTMETETTGANIYYTIGDDVPNNTSTLYDPEDKPTISAGTYNAIACAMVSSNPVYSDITTVTFTQAQVAAPTFSPAGEVLSGTTVTISCATDGAAIQYSTDNGSNWTSGNTVTITTATTLKAKATKDGYADSEVATADYTIATPMTVAEAIAYIDGSGSSDVDKYASGVIESVVSYNETYHSITYWISDDGTETNRLEVFGGLSGIDGLNFTSTDDLKVGDEVIVKGKLKKYNSTYEFDSNNHLVYLHREASIHCSDIALAWNQTSDQKTAVINVSGGELTASTEDTWYSVSVSGTTVSVTTTPNTTASQRNGTVTLTYTYDTKATITKDITVTQAAKPAMCTVSFNVNGTVTMTTDVPQGEELDLSNFEAPVESDTYSFAGWTKSSPNSMITTFTPETDQTEQTLYAVYGVVSYQLITNPNDLEAGKKVIITNAAHTYAISTTQKTNNRAATEITYSGGVLGNLDDVCELTLGTKTVDNTDYWTFYTGSGYLYAASSSANQLKTKASIDDNCAFSVSISNNNTTIQAQGSNTRNVIKYNPNNNSPMFSCYASSYTDNNVTLCSIFQKNISSYTTSIGTLKPTTSMSNIPEDAVVVVKDGTVLTLTGDNNGYATSLIIEDGGQLICSSPVAMTVEKDIYNDGKEGNKWYTISTPVHTGDNPYVTPGNVTNLILMDGDDPEYDMFYYDEYNTTHSAPYWINHSSNLNIGQGYLYRNSNAKLSFKGTNNNEDDYTYYLKCTSEAGPLAGFNLIGNPYPHDIYKNDVYASSGDNLPAINDENLSVGYYKLSNEATWHSYIGYNNPIKPGEGILVKTSSATTLKISNNTNPAASYTPSKYGYDHIEFIVSNNQYEDVAYVMFNDGIGLDKISHRDENAPMIYIPQNGKDYAIATMKDNTETFGLSFKAMTTGKYTISAKALGNFSYIHLIDRFTGEDVDLLLEDYSFIGSPADSDARFIVKLTYMPNSGIEGNDNFAYQAGSEILVSGEGELQIFDVTGRKVMTTTINGVEAISGLQQGVYIFRVIGENQKTQKIVVR